MLTPGPTRTSTPSSTILTGESDSILLSRSEHFIDSLELTEKEKIEKAKKEKIILHGNTRLARTPWKSESQEEKIRKAVENREAMEAGEILRMYNAMSFQLNISTIQERSALTGRRSRGRRLPQLTGSN